MYISRKYFYPLNEGVRIVGIGLTNYTPIINLNFNTGLSLRGTSFSGASGTPLTMSVARDNTRYMICTMNSASNVNAAYYTTNRGENWTTIPYTSGFCVGNCISDNGAVMAATTAAASTLLWISTDYGSSWTQKSLSTPVISSLCCSSDGSKIFISPTNTAYSKAALSTDTGATWSEVTLPATGWYGSCMTGNGSRIWIARFDNSTPKAVHYSDNNGSSWTQVTLDVSAVNNGQFIKCSKDGTYLICGQGSPANTLYVSSNSGANWTKKTLAENVYQLSVQVSSSGKYMCAASTANNGRIYYSDDYGSNWQSLNTGHTTQFRALCIEED